MTLRELCYFFFFIVLVRIDMINGIKKETFGDSRWINTLLMDVIIESALTDCES